MAIAVRAILVSAVVFPISFLSGMMFPLAIRLGSISGESPERVAGTIYGANALGAVAGAILAGFVGIPLLSRLFVSGIQTSIIMCGALILVVSIYVALMTGARRRLLLSIASASGLAVLVLFFAPKWQPSLMTSGLALYDWQALSRTDRQTLLHRLGAGSGAADSPDILFYREGLNSTVSVTANPRTNVTFLRTDGKVEGGVPTDRDKPAPGSDLVTQVLLGQLPVILHPDVAGRVLVIGYGTGTTSGSVLSSSAVRELTIAELEESVLVADRYFKHANGAPLRREWLSRDRTKPRAIDGRNLLAAEKQKFDAIVSQPAEPWVAGSADLYTLEFWRLAKSKLAENGIFCQWVQLYAVTPEYLAVLTRTFTSVFPNTYAFLPLGAGEMILIGSRQPLSFDAQKISERLSDPNVAADLKRIGIITSQQLLNSLRYGPRQLQDFEIRMRDKYHRSPVNTDDNLLTEYKLAPHLYEVSDTIDENLRALSP